MPPRPRLRNRPATEVGSGNLKSPVAAADREDSPGWRANGLAMRAMLRIVLGDSDLGEHDVDGVLWDLIGAEAGVAVAEPGDPLVVSSAHNLIAIGYYTLRLYELADPHYSTAYEMAARLDPAGVICVTVQLNLAELHLAWALELYRVVPACRGPRRPGRR